jgi:hypothetical protein
MSWTSLALGIVVLGYLSMIAQATPPGDQKSAQYIQVEIKGKLKTGLAAIGGEATGYAIAAKGAVWELEFGDKVELRKLADTLGGQGGKVVIVKGSYEVRAGVEIKERHIVTVSSLVEAGK